MPIALIILILVLVAMFYRRRTTTLTRNCRWRQDTSNAVWRCAFCGAETPDTGSPPTFCAHTR